MLHANRKLSGSRRLERRPEPEAEGGRVAIVAVQGRIDDRVVGQGHVHMGKEREAVEDLGVVLAPGSGQARLNVVECDAYHVILDVTDKIRVVEQEEQVGLGLKQRRVVVTPAVLRDTDHLSIRGQLLLKLDEEPPAIGA